MTPAPVSGPCLCPGCGAEVEPLMFQGQRYAYLCAACAERRETERRDAAEAGEMERRESIIAARIPSEFRRELDPEMLHPRLNKLAGEEKLPRGWLGLVGVSGAGKTRALCALAARRVRATGAGVRAVSDTEHTRLALAAAISDEAGEDLARLRRVPLLIYDDLGKSQGTASKSTERADAALFDLLDTRYSKGLPVWWTSNFDSKKLLARYGADRGPAILSRLLSGKIINCKPTKKDS